MSWKRWKDESSWKNLRLLLDKSKDDLIAKIKEYKAGTRNVAGNGEL